MNKSTKPITTLTVETKIQPPPTKREMIEAMAQVKYKENLESNLKNKKRADELQATVAASVYARVKNDPRCIPVFTGYSNSRLEIYVEKFLTADDKKKLAASDELRIRLSTDMQDIRSAITASVNGLTPTSERIKTLVETNGPEISKLLKAIESKKPQPLSP